MSKAQTFTPETNLKLYQLKFTADTKENSNVIQSIAQKNIDEIIHKPYEKHWEFKASTLKRRNKNLGNLIQLKPKVIREFGLQKDTKFTVYYYAYVKDYHFIDNQFWLQFKSACSEAKIAVNDLL